MKHANEVRKITKEFQKTSQQAFDEYIINICENLYKAIERQASKGATQCALSIRQNNIASAVATRFKQFGYNVEVNASERFYEPTNLITISW